MGCSSDHCMFYFDSPRYVSKSFHGLLLAEAEGAFNDECGDGTWLVYIKLEARGPQVNEYRRTGVKDTTTSWQIDMEKTTLKIV